MKSRFVNFISLMVVMIIQLFFHRRVRNAMEFF